MRDFRKATPERQYEVYCPGCKKREGLTWEDMEWLQTYQRIGQHPWYSCRKCCVHMQVRPLRQKASVA